MDATWWRGVDSNHRRLSRQIYSLIPLATREPLLKRGDILGEPSCLVNNHRLIRLPKAVEVPFAHFVTKRTRNLLIF